MECMTVGSAEDMARLLHNASLEASGFARAEHEKACAGHDAEYEAFWREVADLLADPAALQPTHPAPRRPVTLRRARPIRLAPIPRGMVKLARR